MADQSVSDRDAKRRENCGLLAVLDPSGLDWIPAREMFRRTGNRASPGAPLFVPAVKCAEGRRYFTGDGETADKYNTQEWVALLREDQSRCESFIRWVPSLSIRDHKEMLDREYMIEREDRRDTEMRAREDRRDDRVEAHHRQDLAVLGGLVILAMVVSAMIAAGWIDKPWGSTDHVPQPVIVVTATPDTLRTP